MQEARHESRWHRQVTLIYAAPLWLALGIAVYFLLPVEPPLWLVVGVVPIALLTWVLRHHYRLFLGLLAVTLLSFGFIRAMGEGWRLQAPILSAPIFAKMLEGEVMTREPRGSGIRLVIAPYQLDSLDDAGLPAHVRVTLSGDHPLLAVGDVIRVRATLFPPSPPLFPGGFNLARHLYFQRIGATGYAVGSPTILRDGGEEKVVISTMLRRIKVVRQSIADTLGMHLGETQAALAQAVLVGMRGQVAEAQYEMLREAGLAHLLAISGLHMGLMAGIAFMLLRRAMAWSSRLAVRYDLKKWAAIGAAIIATGYLAISGAPVSAQRAWVMVMLLMFAIWLDREAMPMRLLVIAAIALLLIAPYQLLTPGFQLSFAATFALISCYQWWAEHREPEVDMIRPLQRIKRVIFYPVGVATSSLIAALATAPFTLFHFHSLTLAGVAANVVAIPLMGFCIMPFGLLALLLMPLGLEGWPLMVMGWGLDWMLHVAEWTVVHIPLRWHWNGMQVWALSMITLAGILFAWRVDRPGRAIALAMILFALLLNGGVAPDQPALLASEDGIVFQNANYEWQRADEGKENWTIRVWQDALGVKFLPAEDTKRCDAAGCVLYTVAGPVEWLQDPRGIMDSHPDVRLTLMEWRAPHTRPCTASLGRRTIALLKDAEDPCALWNSADVNKGRYWE